MSRFTRAFRGTTCLTVAGLAVALWLPPLQQAEAQKTPGTRALVAVPAQKSPDTELTVAVDRPELRIGQTVSICFQSSKPGFATLWNISTEGAVSRIYPNAFQPAGSAQMTVEGGKQVCAGQGGDAFRFQVEGPPGMEDLYLLWTATPDAQPKPNGYRDAQSFAADIERLRGALGSNWGTAKTSYEIVPATGAVAPTLPAPAAQGSIAAPPAAPAPAPSQQASAPPRPPAPPASAPPPASSPVAQVPIPPPLPVLPQTAMPAPTQSPPPPVPSRPAPPPQAATPTPAPQAAVAPPRPAPAPQPTGPQPGDVEKGRVFILAMGANVKPLTKPNQDAALFAEVVSKMFSVQSSDMKVLANATKDDFQGGIDWLRRSTRPQDLVMIFYSGHGAQIRDTTGTSTDGLDEAFVPYDFETMPKPSLSKLVWAQEYARWVNTLPTNNVITIADACHSAGLTRSLSSETLGAKSKFFTLPADIDTTLPPDVQAAQRTPGTRALGGANRVRAKGVLLAAAARNQTALEASEGGIFTMALLRAMVNAHDGTMSDVFQTVVANVGQRTGGKQTPEAVGDLKPTSLVTFGD